jgi:aspartyl-tRNA(Asn)/glutamyl-tRNA(Gln) amidotransferase subunit B
VNVSVNQPGQPFGTRCELKNLTSIRFLTAAIGKKYIHMNDMCY